MSHSTGRLSATSWIARSVTLSRGTLHLGNQAFDSPVARPARCRVRRFVQHNCRLLVAVPELEAPDDCLAISRLQPLERRFVPFRILRPDGSIQRRKLLVHKMF